MARVQIGVKIGDNGKKQPVYQYLGYFQTQREAKECLADYNAFRTPHGRRVTLGTLWGEFYSQNEGKWSYNTLRAKTNAWRILEPYADIDINKINVSMYEDLFLKSGKNTPTLQQAKTLINSLYSLAVKKQYTTPEYCAFIRYIELPARTDRKIEHVRIPREVIEDLWSRSENNIDVQGALFLIYTGVRVSEFVHIKPEDMHIEERWFVVDKSKTEAGRGRIVPISEKIAPFIENWLKLGYKTVAPYERLWRQTDPAGNFRRRFEAVLPGYRPHDARYTCVSELVEAKTPDAVIRSIVGHKDLHVTSRYTKISLETKLEYINLIK